MNEVMAKGLEGALKAAVEPNGSAGNGNGGGSTNDLVNLALKVLPKLIENSEASEDVVELEKGCLRPAQRSALFATAAE